MRCVKVKVIFWNTEQGKQSNIVECIGETTHAGVLFLSKVKYGHSDIKAKYIYVCENGAWARYNK